MAGSLQKFLNVNLGIAESRFRFFPRGLESFLKLVFVPDDAHAAPAAARGSFDDDGVAYSCRFPEKRGVIVDRSVAPRHDGNIVLDGQVPSVSFVAQGGNGFAGRADESHVAGIDDLCEMGVLGKEAVAGMDRVGVRHFASRYDPGNVEITVGSRGSAYAVSFVGVSDVQRIPVGFTKDRHACYTHFPAGADHTQSDLAPVGYKYLAKHFSIPDALRRESGRIPPADRFQRRSSL